MTLKAVQYKLYGNLQSLPVFTNYGKNLLMNFIIGLPILTDWKKDSHDLIFVIGDRLIKIVHYKPVTVTIDALCLPNVIIDIVVRHYGLLDLIVTNRKLLFTLKFWLLLCYFLGIKQKLFIAFYPQTDGQIMRQNSMMKAYL